MEVRRIPFPSGFKLTQPDNSINGQVIRDGILKTKIPLLKECELILKEVRVYTKEFAYDHKKMNVLTMFEFGNIVFTKTYYCFFEFDNHEGLNSIVKILIGDFKHYVHESFVEEL